MRRTRDISERTGERGIVILLVAVFLLAVVGAMAALAIDVVTFYTARSEAQLAADGAALAGARVLANSGMTSDPNAVTDGLAASAKILARTIATQVATQNKVGGRTLNAAEVTVSFPNEGDPAAFGTNPQVNVQTTRTDLPTFFARMLRYTQVTVVASATAEAYNPSGMAGLGSVVSPVAPLCTKPWLLPNLDPTQAAGGTNQIFTPTTGAITAAAAGLVGKSWPDTSNPALNQAGLYSVCGDCSPGGGGIPAPVPGQYYPGPSMPPTSLLQRRPCLPAAPA